MNNYQSITESPETLAAFLGSIPAIETPWDDAFHRLYCSSCAAADCVVDIVETDSCSLLCKS